MTESSHNGRSIQLRSGQRQDGTWVCEYTIIEASPTRSNSVKRAHKGNFSTREEAEAAVLDEAQAEINSQGPFTQGRSDLFKVPTDNQLNSPRFECQLAKTRN